ncbi:MAG: glycosyltransferase family 39 protein, partial [Candidatus Omnitrophica bacterium]|nr:glycosyltransferase family 39 protein [Candidatus Omnitrophota bacterium]
MLIKKIPHFFILLLLTLFFGVNNYLWLRLNQRPPVDDEAAHLISALRYVTVISGPQAGKLLQLLKVDHTYPPLSALSAALVSFLFGKSTVVFIMSNLIFLFGIFVCLYLIGIKMGDRRVGVLASILLSFYPMFFQLSRMFMIEIALCFMVVASIAALLYSEGFKKLIPSIACGVLLGTGLLTKQFYIIFIAGPLLLAALDSLLKADAVTRWRIGRNIGAFLAIGIFIAAPWYTLNLKHMLRLGPGYLFDPNYVPWDIPVLSFRSLFFYPDTLLNNQVLWFFFLLFIAALFILAKRKKDGLFFLLLLWIIVPYIFFTFLKNKFLYYTMASLPAIALITAEGIMRIKRNSVKKAIICALLIIGLVQYFSISYVRHRYLAFHIGFDTDIPAQAKFLRISFFPMTDILAGVKYFPQKGDWKYDAIAKRIASESGGAFCNVVVYDIDPNFESKKNHPGAVILTKFKNYGGANPYGLSYYFALGGLPHRVIPLSSYPQGNTNNKVHFIISPLDLKQDSRGIIKAQNYSLIEEFIMSDASKVYLYKLNEAGAFNPAGVIPERAQSSGRIDVYSDELKFALEEVKSNGVVQCGEWLSEKEKKTSYWMAQMTLAGESWQLLWVEFTPKA